VIILSQLNSLLTCTFFAVTGFESRFEHHQTDGGPRSKAVALPTRDRTPDEEHLRSLTSVVESECGRSGS